MSTSGKRPYDLVLYGATGFTGSQGARALAGHADREQYRYAIAGRNREKLERLRDRIDRECSSDESSSRGPDGVLVADAKDAAAIDALVAQTRVVATTAGPFWEYGDELVRACVEQAVDYVDITGETPWIRTLIDRFHDSAELDGTRIVPCCGYDSVPSDLGTWFATRQLRERTGENCREVRAFHRGRGGLNGGTVASLLNLQKLGKTSELDDPFLLNPEGLRPSASSSEARRDRDPTIPYYERTLGTWAAPFFMGPINTRVVRRSQALLQEFGEGYGADFRYQEYWKSSGPLGWFESSSLATIQAAALLFARSPMLAGLGERLAPAPGSGPSERAMDNGFFNADFVATGTRGSELHTRLSGQGDPGNRITIKCLVECALALLLDRDRLPSRPAGGILTPVTAIGSVLVERLEEVGMEFDVIE